MKACLAVAETHGLTVEGGELSDIDLRHRGLMPEGAESYAKA